MIEAGDIPFPAKLARYVDGERLRVNALKEPVMQRDLSEGEALAVQAVKNLLLGIDLSHGTNKPIPHVDKVGILPDSVLQSEKNNTGRFDREFGLDEYTFAHWGAFYRAAGYGSHIYALDARSVLLSNKTIVSPRDITFTIFNDRNERRGKPEQPLSEIAEPYFNSLVTGADWLEITARKVLSGMRSTNNPDIVRLDDSATLGEIKHFGPIDPSAIKGTVSTHRQEENRWRDMLEHGFAVPPVTFAVEELEETGAFRDNDYYRLPEQIGADIGKSKKIWREIVEMARS